ncbi:MAG: hypothetical protein U0270_39520 [Labilithrix sp.]
MLLRRSGGLFFLTFVLLPTACGLDVVGVAPEGTGPESGAPQGPSVDASDASRPGDVLIEEAGPHDGGQDVVNPPLGCDVTACAALGAKWKPIAVAIGASPATCPSGATDVLRTDPVAAAGACGCRPVNPVAPVCNTGTITFRVNGGCNATGVATSSNSSSCHPVSGSLAGSVAFASLAPSGGSCTAETTTDMSKLGSSALTMCTEACSADLCAKKAPAGFRACLVTDGDVACDAPGFTEKHLAGTPTLSCAACTSCTATATCTNVSIDLFSGTSCTTKVFHLPADACTNTGGASGSGVGGMIYNATVTPSYQATGPLTATTGLGSPRTVCCAP